MKVVLDTDILSTFARINRLDVLNRLFDKVIVPPSVISELRKAEIKFGSLDSEVARLTRNELLTLKGMDARLGRGERECLAIAKHRNFPLASNDRIVHSICEKEGVGYFDLPRLLRFAILKKVVAREEAMQLVNLIEHEERTVIVRKGEIFK